jgi:Protein of unknown function (DUF2846)
MNSVRRLLVAGCAGVAIATVVCGCAIGPKFADMASSMPALKPNEGRIYFFRSASLRGAAVQPNIRLNGEIVGQSKPGGYFYVDRPAGNYVASSSTETEKTASFALDAGETKYLRTWVSLGLLIGRVVIEIETPDKAKAELPSLSLTTNDARAK